MLHVGMSDHSVAASLAERATRQPWRYTRTDWAPRAAAYSTASCTAVASIATRAGSATSNLERLSGTSHGSGAGTAGAASTSTAAAVEPEGTPTSGAAQAPVTETAASRAANATSPRRPGTRDLPVRVRRHTCCPVIARAPRSAAIAKVAGVPTGGLLARRSGA